MAAAAQKKKKSIWQESDDEEENWKILVQRGLFKDAREQFDKVQKDIEFEFADTFVESMQLDQIQFLFQLDPRFGESALRYAIVHPNIGLIRWLLDDVGVDPNAANALFVAMDYLLHDETESIIKLLVERSTNPARLDYKSDLYYLPEELKHLTVLEYLALKEGDNVFKQDKKKIQKILTEYELTGADEGAVLTKSAAKRFKPLFFF